MGQKWIRSKQWDDTHIPRRLWPVKALLRAFSSIPLAVVLLSLVVVYAILASVPVGMLALLPTYAIYAATLLLTLAAGCVLPLVLVRRLLRRGGARFAVTLAGAIVLGAASAGAWVELVWPALHYDPATGRGLRLFADFAERYASVTVRRLPALEMTEIEFYAWWPLRLVLLLFVANMVTATLRRIEFKFVNLGVLTVHAGIVLIALGSVYYGSRKLEGDTILLAGPVDARGVPAPGPVQEFFYDNVRVALWIKQAMGWEQRALDGLPRYNDYALNAIAGRTVRGEVGRTPAVAATDGGRTLDLRVPGGGGLVDQDLEFRVVGYASYAEPREDWLLDGAPEFGGANPVRFVELWSSLPRDMPQGVSDPGALEPAEDRRIVSFFFLPGLPAHRGSDTPAFVIDCTIGMSEDRWRDLTEPLPEETRHALVIEVPASDGGGPGHREVVPIVAGAEVPVGETGYRVLVKELAAEPPFPIITEGYRDATSSVAIVRITTPTGDGFDRWLYSRFPELTQDLLDELNENGMPRRRAPDPGIRVAYLDASRLHVHLDERADGTVRAVVRRPGGERAIAEGMGTGSRLGDVVPRISLVLGERWAHARRVELPEPVPPERQDKSFVGTHEKAMLAVEISGGGGSVRWTTRAWVPFSKYIGLNLGTERTLRLPDGRELTLAFGRWAHRLPGFGVQLVDFEMIAYDHRGSPRDYQSVVRVVPTEGDFEAYEHVARLNAPLQAPFMWSEGRGWAANAAGLVASRLNPRQFKFSQAGWDARGWEQTQAAADRGEVERASVAFTILGVGNNPGIHVIALGGVMVGAGIPWAFYIKPWLLQRRKRKIQAELARTGGGSVPGAPRRRGRARAEQPADGPLTGVSA